MQGYDFCFGASVMRVSHTESEFRLWFNVFGPVPAGERKNSASRKGCNAGVLFVRRVRDEDLNSVKKSPTFSVLTWRVTTFSANDSSKTSTILRIL
jgi:hypothetical protein